MKSSIPKDPRIVLAGSVSTSRCTLQALLRNNMQVVGVLGLSISASRNVSGFARLDDLTTDAQIPFLDFQNINQVEVLDTVRKWKPDLLFVVGLSQLVQPDLMSIPSVCCIGFHPTALPAGRGRAPLAWLVLDSIPGAACFFVLEAQADAGALLIREPFAVRKTDYAQDVLSRIERAIQIGLDQWLPKLKKGEWSPTPQDESQATYNGKREPADGLIDWALPAENVFSLIRSSSHPHPGAYSYFNDKKLIIWRAELAPMSKYRGVVGRILVVDPQKGLLVQTGDGCLWLTEISYEDGAPGAPAKDLRVGQKLGMNYLQEIMNLKQRVQILEKQISDFQSAGKGEC